VIGGLVSAKLIPAFGWASVFIAGGLLPLLVLPLLIAFVPESVRFLALKKARAEIVRVLGRMGSAGEWNGEFPVATAEVRAPISSLFSEGRALGTVLLWTTLFFSLLLTYLLVNWMPIIARRAGLGIEAAVTAVAMLNLGAVVGCLLIGRLADRLGPAVVIGTGYVLGAVAIVLIGHAGHSSVLLCAIAFVAGALSLGAQMCAVALCASFYETFLRATGVGWGMGIGRGGAIVGPILGGLLLAAGVDASTLFVVAGLTSLLSGAAVLAMGVFVPRMRALREPGRPLEARSA
jgi:AAHS family 4-hydroxybenzoate transporter-like MFS transporter